MVKKRANGEGNIRKRAEDVYKRQSEHINAQIRAFSIALTESKLPGIVELVPTYRSLMAHYDPEVIPYGVLVKKLKGLLNQLDHIRIPPSDVLEIPVLYGGEEMVCLLYTSRCV